MNIAINIVARVCRPMFIRIGFHTHTRRSFAQKWRQALVNMVYIVRLTYLYRGALGPPKLEQHVTSDVPYSTVQTGQRRS